MSGVGTTRPSVEPVDLTVELDRERRMLTVGHRLGAGAGAEESQMHVLRVLAFDVHGFHSRCTAAVESSQC